MDDLLRLMACEAGVDEGAARAAVAERERVAAAAAELANTSDGVERAEREREAAAHEAEVCCTLFYGATRDLAQDAALVASAPALRAITTTSTSSNVEALQHQSIIWLASKFETLCAHHLGGTKWWTHFEQWLWSRRHACAAERAATANALVEQHAARLVSHAEEDKRRAARRAAQRAEEGFSSEEEGEDSEEEGGTSAKAAAAGPVPPTTAPLRRGGLVNGDSVIPEGEAVFFDEELSRKLVAGGRSKKAAAGLCEELGRLATRAARTLRRRTADAAGRRRAVHVERVWVGNGADADADAGLDEGPSVLHFFCMLIFCLLIFFCSSTS